MERGDQHLVDDALVARQGRRCMVEEAWKANRWGVFLAKLGFQIKIYSCWPPGAPLTLRVLVRKRARLFFHKGQSPTVPFHRLLCPPSPSVCRPAPLKHLPIIHSLAAVTTPPPPHLHSPLLHPFLLQFTPVDACSLLAAHFNQPTSRRPA